MYMGVLSSYIEQEYTAGFYTDIESESLPKGLNEAEPRFVTQSSIDYRQMHFTLVFKTLRQEVWELLPSSLLNCCWLQLQDIVRRIWEIKEEPDWMLEFRLNAFRSKVWEPWIFGGWAESQNLKTMKKKILETISCRKWQKMEMPEWAHLEMEQIDFQDFAHRVFGKKQRKTHFEVSSPCKSRKAFKEYQNRSPVGHCVLFQTEVKAEEAEPGWGFWKRVADSSSRSVHIFHDWCGTNSKYVAVLRAKCVGACIDSSCGVQVDPELLDTFEKLGIPLTEQKAWECSVVCGGSVGGKNKNCAWVFANLLQPHWWDWDFSRMPCSAWPTWRWMPSLTVRASAQPSRRNCKRPGMEFQAYIYIFT